MFAGPYIAGALLLAIAAVGKMRKPATAAAAMRALRLPSTTLSVRIVALAEFAVAITALVIRTHWAAGTLAFAYLAFSIVVAFLIVSGEREISCGCFGVDAAPVAPMHLVTNLALAGFALVVAIGHHVPTIPRLLSSGASGVAVVLAACVGAWSLVVVLTDLPITYRIAMRVRAQSHRDARDGSGRAQPFRIHDSRSMAASAPQPGGAQRG